MTTSIQNKADYCIESRLRLCPVNDEHLQFQIRLKEGYRKATYYITLLCEKSLYIHWKNVSLQLFPGKFYSVFKPYWLRVHLSLHFTSSILLRLANVCTIQAYQHKLQKTEVDLSVETTVLCLHPYLDFFLNYSFFHVFDIYNQNKKLILAASKAPK